MKKNKILLKSTFLFLFLILFAFIGNAQNKTITGKVTDESGQALPGVTVVVKGSTQGTVTTADGAYTISSIPENATLVFSFVGMLTQEIVVGNQTTINVEMEVNTIGIDEVVAIGYGTQKKSDITGSVASLSEDRLEMVPNTNITQAIQGAISGIQISTTSGGASPNNNSIMIRGRNSIKAGNSPLIVLDGFPYSGQLGDINPDDIKSVEILKDASSAAIYGSRGANGVILITTKIGKDSKPKISYDGYYNTQRLTNFPDLLTGPEFYQFKLDRKPSEMTQTEEDIYNSGTYPDWKGLALRNGSSQKHNISISGGTDRTKYYFSVGLLDINGLAVNDDYMRLTNRINLESKVTDWLTVGTRSTVNYNDESGRSPSIGTVLRINPLTNAYNEDGTLTVYPNPESTAWPNPLEGTLAENSDLTYQLVSNNFVKVDLPFIKGLSYTLNGGVRVKITEDDTYYGRNTRTGYEAKGDADVNRSKYANYTVENLVNYVRDFGKNSIFLTALYGYEKYERNSDNLSAKGFPHDILKWYGASQAELIVPSISYSSTRLISQMLRLNYTYDNRYLLTATGRRDGYSGFGKDTKWGVFPSVALGWNIANESFFTPKDIINTLKLRASWGQNGNQAVGAYETISRMSAENWVSGASTMPGYKPNKLGEDNLGWETTESLNLGLDFGLWNNRVSGDINYYISNTTDLLLNRSISAVHGLTSVTQNIGATKNTGMEFSIHSTNVNLNGFKWSTSLNLTFMKNEIVSLYGLLDEEGKEMDDVGSRWFIGEPIRVYYDHKVIGVWQLDEADEAAKYGSEPGWVKLEDTNLDDVIDAEDLQILGQRDPSTLWGMTNTFEYKNFVLNIFIHGMRGAIKVNDYLEDNVWTDVTRNTVKKNWWTPDNPTNDFYANDEDAGTMSGQGAAYYEKSDFIRIKDISLAYNLPESVLERVGMDKIQIYTTARNLVTFTNYGGMDPELGGQRGIPLQKEFVIGLNIGL